MEAIEKLKEYKNESNEINNKLRNGIVNSETCLIDALFSRKAVPSILYRLLDNKYINIIDGIFCDPAYLSCTKDIDEFICKTDPTNHIACIIIQMKSPFLCINVSEIIPEFDDEGEYILPRELKLRLVGYKKLNSITEFDEFLDKIGSCTGSNELWKSGIKHISLYNMEIMD